MTITNIILNNNFDLNIPITKQPLDIKILLPIIKELKHKIEILEKEKNEMKQSIEYLLNENKQIKNEMIENNKKLEEKIKSIENLNKYIQKNQEPNQNKYFINSDIIKQENDIDLLIKFLEKKPDRISLLFNSNIDGDSLQNFHNKVDYKSPTYIIIKTVQNRIFGGFTNHVWNVKNEGCGTDNKAFVFSLDKKKKYNIIYPESAIFENKDFFQFGCCCFKIFNNCTNKNNIELDSSFDTKNYCLSGEHTFKVKSYEAHLIEYTG